MLLPDYATGSLDGTQERSPPVLQPPQETVVQCLDCGSHLRNPEAERSVLVGRPPTQPRQGSTLGQPDVEMTDNYVISCNARACMVNSYKTPVSGGINNR